jgi:ABC-type sugar transport system substrate-binding protein
MKLKIVMAVLALFVFAGATGLAAAQETKKTTHKKTRALTGCLQKSDDANEYNLTTGKGGTWEVKSDSVDLSKHVGHTVTVTGVVSNAKMHGMKEDAKDEAQEHGMDKKATEHGHLTATHVKMVSEGCKE